MAFRKHDVDHRHERCRSLLQEKGQQHLLQWWQELENSARVHLLDEIESIPWGTLDPLIDTHIRNLPTSPIPNRIEPAQPYPQAPTNALKPLYEKARNLGESLLREGSVAALTVAGGQGTRLGFDGPKGCLTITPVRGKTLFQLFSEMIVAARRRNDSEIPWYIMTSKQNHKQTQGFLEDNEYFGLPEKDVILFSQEMLPAFDFEGRVLMQDKHRLALAPDGHGGALKALVSSGSLADMQRRGIQHITYFQIDNPLVKPFDPLFIGLHAQTESEMSTKVTPKVSDLEKVGNIVRADDSLQVIEYTCFPDHFAHAKTEDGQRKFDVGSLGIHLLDVSFIERVIARKFELPYRRAEKCITWMDENGFLRTPRVPNGVKLETFVFDVLPLANNPLLLEVPRCEEFSPVKQAKGENSVESAIKAQVRRNADWLVAAGVRIPYEKEGDPDVLIEIAPSYALDHSDVLKKVTRPPILQSGETIYIS